MATEQAIFDVGEVDFERRVLSRSRELPVVVDFWAAWCGPCKVLGPILEQAASARAGSVELAKVDVDRNQLLAARFGVQGIPAVKAFRDGRIVSEFTGALPPPQVEAFFSALVPSEADQLAARGQAEGDEAALRRALELDPRHSDARRALGGLLVRNGQHQQALEALKPVVGDFVAEALRARAELELSGETGLPPAFEAWDRGDYGSALELMQEALSGAAEPERREVLRRLMVGLFNELGADHPLAREHRRRLSAALS